MTKRISITIGTMAAAVALTATGAHATPTPLFSGGGTAVEKVYRDLFNAYGNNSSGDLCFGRPVCPTPYNTSVEVLYLGVGSNGLKAIDANESSLLVSSNKVPDAVPVGSTRDFGPYYGTGTGASWVPADTGPYYPKLSFSASDNVLTSTDISTAQTSLGNNPLLQFPSLVEVETVVFQPAANWNPHGVTTVGASSKVQFSTNTLCGIFTGKITTWNDPLITKDNAGVRLGTGKITVVYRNDSAGATFLFTNALINQCGTVSRRTKSQFPIPNQWLTDNSLTAKSTTVKPYYKSNTSFFINVFNAGHLPANFYNDPDVTNVNGGAVGSGGVQKAVLATTGSIGYLSPDFAKPVDTSGPLAANLQTYVSFSAGSTPVYRAPTATNGEQIMANTKPPAFPTAAANPLNWGALNPLPAGATTYPIGGFTFIDLRRCYTSAGDAAALAGTTAGTYGVFTWLYAASSVNGGKPAAILATDGFAPVPAAWAASINRLLTSPTLGIGTAGTGTNCKTVAHGA